MTGKAVLVEDRGSVRIVTLNRPEKRNAIDIPMRLELADAIMAADHDSALRAVVITGAGAAFCSGGDIASMERMDPSEAIKRARLAQRVVRAIWNTPKPVVAAVEGCAYGAGVALAAACDRVVAGRDTRFATTFKNVGLAGDMGIYASLPARIGIGRARQMLLMPTPIDAPSALQIGLIDGIADPGAALQAALADAEQLAAGPAQAYGVVKSLLRISSTGDPLEILDREAEHQAQLFDTDDFTEGIAAFREGRRPKFRTSP